MVSPPRATAGRRRRTRGRRGSVRINASNPASAYGDTDVEALAAAAALYAPTLLAEPCLSGSPSMKLGPHRGKEGCLLMWLGGFLFVEGGSYGGGECRDNCGLCSFCLSRGHRSLPESYFSVELGAGEVGDIVDDSRHGLHLCPLAGGLLVIDVASRALAAKYMIFSG